VRECRVIRIIAVTGMVIGLASLAPARAADRLPSILVFGDSISAGYGIAPEQGWAQLLAKRLKTEGYGYRVVNASVSGETTAGGLARLPRALQIHKPAVVVLELGGNDGLRALPTNAMAANLTRLADLASASGARVLLLGMRLPPNYGPDYTAKFAAVYGRLATDRRLSFVPFLLAGVATQGQWMQDDGIHPNAAGQPRLLDNVWVELVPLLAKKNQAAVERRLIDSHR
jgi:acyl-CoA thioesterase I